MIELIDGPTTNRWFEKCKKHQTHLNDIQIYMECAHCRKVKACFCNDCTYTLSYSDGDKIRDLRNEPDRQLQFITDALNNAEQTNSRRYTEDNNTTMLLACDYGVAPICSINCFEAWKFNPKETVDNRREE